MSRAAGRVSVAGGRHLILEEILKDCDLGDAYGMGGSIGGAPMSVTSELISLPPAAAVVALAEVVGRAASAPSPHAYLWHGHNSGGGGSASVGFAGCHGWRFRRAQARGQAAAHC